MPVSVNRIMKMGTPRIDLNPGTYPGIIVGVIYPKEKDGNCMYTRCEYLLQVHRGNDVCYVPTIPFDVSINEDSNLFELLSGLTGMKTAESLYKWLDDNDYFQDDTFDERDFLGCPVNAVVARRKHKNPPFHTYNIVTGFAPILETLEPELKTNRLIPCGFVNPKKYELEKLDELEVDMDYLERAMPRRQ